MMDVESKAYRFTVLLFNCLLTFGSYYCFDMPGVLQTHIEDQVVAGFSADVATYYNAFYTIYAWVNMAMSLAAGLLVDRIGTVKSMFLFLTLCLVGASIFALGALLTDMAAESRYIMMVRAWCASVCLSGG
jgi:fucose permease